MLTAKGDPMDRMIGLEMGADDYLPSRLSRASCWRASAPSCAGARDGGTAGRHARAALWLAGDRPRRRAP